MTCQQRHIWSNEWAVTKEATETEEGRKETFCDRGCGQKKIAIIPSMNAANDIGNLEKDAEVEKDVIVEGAIFHNLTTELVAATGIFTENEKKEVQQGVDARVWIEISKTDENVILPEEKESIEEVVEMMVGDDSEICYFEIDLFKQVGDKAKTKISEPGVAVQITILIPEILRNQNESMVREYKIVRLHEGKVDIIDGTFNSATGEFLFESDQFSTYAIIYKDTVKVENQEPSVKQTPVKPEIPKTADKTNSIPYIVIFIVGYMFIVFAGKRKVVR